MVLAEQSFLGDERRPRRRRDAARDQLGEVVADARSSPARRSSSAEAAAVAPDRGEDQDRAAAPAQPASCGIVAISSGSLSPM